MNVLIVCKLLDDFTTYDSCLWLHVVLYALHELSYNSKVVILVLSFSLTTSLSRFQTVLDFYDNLIQYFGQRPLLRKHALQCQLQDGGTETM